MPTLDTIDINFFFAFIRKTMNEALLTLLPIEELPAILKWDWIFPSHVAFFFKWTKTIYSIILCCENSHKSFSLIAFYKYSKVQTYKFY